MAMLDRYKKKGGFVQLLTLIETSSKQKQDQFLTLIGQEDQGWEEYLKMKMLSIERVLRWPKEVLAEVFTRTQPLTLSVAFHGNTQESIDEIFECLSNTDKRKLMLKMSELNPTPAEKASCHVKLLAEIRGLVNQGVIKLDKFDHDLHIPENIEDQIQKEGLERKIQNHSESGLVFPDFGNTGSDSQHTETSTSETSRKETSRDVSRDTSKDSAKDTGFREEVEFLKKRVNLLTHENTVLRQDLQLLKNKLEQIKKIA